MTIITTTTKRRRTTTITRTSTSITAITILSYCDLLLAEQATKPAKHAGPANTAGDACRQAKKRDICQPRPALLAIPGQSASSAKIWNQESIGVKIVVLTVITTIKNGCWLLFRCCFNGCLLLFPFCFYSNIMTMKTFQQ